jgi:hypothetical protein
LVGANKVNLPLPFFGQKNSKDMVILAAVIILVIVGLSAIGYMMDKKNIF